MATYTEINHVHADDHVLGSAKAPLTLITYCDFECPYCRAAAPMTRRLGDQLDGDLRLVFRHFPLIDKHPAALRAAEAAEAAGEQGRFWEMHDVLFQNQDKLEHQDLLAYAGALGLDMRFFEESLLTHRHLNRIARDVKIAIAAGAPGTPTFFLNGEMYEDEKQLVEAIELLRSAD